MEPVSELVLELELALWPGATLWLGTDPAWWLACGRCSCWC